MGFCISKNKHFDLKFLVLFKNPLKLLNSQKVPMSMIQILSVHNRVWNKNSFIRYDWSLQSTRYKNKVCTRSWIGKWGSKMRLSGPKKGRFAEWETNLFHFGSWFRSVFEFDARSWLCFFSFLIVTCSSLLSLSLEIPFSFSSLSFCHVLLFSLTLCEIFSSCCCIAHRSVQTFFKFILLSIIFVIYLIVDYDS